MPDVAERLLSVAEFARLPQPPPAGKTELVDGRVVQTAPAGPEHSREQARLGRYLDTFADQHSLGDVRSEAGYRLSVSEATVRAPGVSFVTAQRVRDEVLLHGFVDGFPDLAVEITSPTDTDADLARKVLEYPDSGVTRVWVVRPELQTVTVHRPGGDSHTYAIGDTLTSDDAGFAVPGFELPLAKLFRRPAAPGA